MSARIRIVFELFNERGDLVNMRATRRLPTAPLLAINRPQIAVCIGPLIPNRDAVLFQIGDICIAGQKPEQLVNDGLQVQFLGRQNRKTVTQIKSHLMAEHRQSAGAGAVVALHAVV